MTDRLNIETLRRIALENTDADAVGIVDAEPVDAEAVEMYRQWVADGCNATMDYLDRYHEVRNDPRLLLDGAKTLIICLFSYANPDAVAAMSLQGLPRVAEYALGDDYHDVLRKKLKTLGKELTARYGGAFRVVIDTAPFRERYWAARAGLGWIGLNNQLIVPGRGAHFFISTLLWTGNPDGQRDTALSGDCGRCGRCIQECPMAAITPDGRIDARRCLSYLTIEDRRPLPDGFTTAGCLYGCDTCRTVCPHEKPDHPSPTFASRPSPLATMTADDWASMTDDDFRVRFRHSAMRRAGLPKIKDTLNHLD